MPVNNARKIMLRKKSDKVLDPVENLVRYNFKVNGGLPRPLVMGIDPGFGGAIAIINADSREIIDMIDMPLWDRPSTVRVSGKQTHLDVHKLSFLIDGYAPFIATAFIEEPGAMPDQGLSSTFRFGHTCGLIHGVLAGHNIPVMPVKPSVWKNALNLSPDKKLSLVRASMEFPAHKDLWPTVSRNDRAEAALLVIYGLKYLNNFVKLNRR